MGKRSRSVGCGSQGGITWCVDDVLRASLGQWWLDSKDDPVAGA